MTQLEKFNKFKNLYAIHNLVPNAKFSMIDGDLTTLTWYDGNDLPRPTDSEIEQKAQELLVQFQQNEYQRQRALEYPKIQEQLDMLYHDIKSGNLENGTWIEAIEEVKNTFPKPE
jgi:hypothetical protein